MDDPLIRRSGHLLEAELGFELVGLDSHQGLCIGFNETAAWTWKLLKTPCTYSELLIALVERFEVDEEECAPGLNDILQEMKTLDLICYH